MKDSLGGNSLTYMVANISPAQFNVMESLSTLQFAMRAKKVKNNIELNEETNGNIELLKSENKRLVNEIIKLKNEYNFTMKDKKLQSKYDELHKENEFNKSEYNHLLNKYQELTDNKKFSYIIFLLCFNRLMFFVIEI